MNIIIISKVIIGMRPNPFGVDKGLNIFKRSLSKKLKDNLEKDLNENGGDYKISIDNSYESAAQLIQNNADLLLISPYVKDYVELDNLNENSCYILSEKEFNKGYTKDIIIYLYKVKNRKI